MQIIFNIPLNKNDDDIDVTVFDVNEKDGTDVSVLAKREKLEYVNKKQSLYTRSSGEELRLTR